MNINIKKRKYYNYIIINGVRYKFINTNPAMYSVLIPYFNLNPIFYNQQTITHQSIHAFTNSSKCMNDTNNKIRETIIGAIINKQIPIKYYIINKWRFLKTQIFKYINKLDEDSFNTAECIHTGGRTHYYDFQIVLYYDNGVTKSFNIELKYNASTIDDAPQFISPMKPSQYMSDSFENYYYDNYLPILSSFTQLTLPTKEEYLKQIHSESPTCMKLYQNMYYNGCSSSRKYTNNEKDIQFYELAKKISKECITNFINSTELNIELLSSYLYNTQKDKIYMLYSDKTFTLQHVDMNHYIIDSVDKNATKSKYTCISKSGKKLNVLLRWKNGNGIAFPAFQIS